MPRKTDELMMEEKEKRSVVTSQPRLTLTNLCSPQRSGSLGVGANILATIFFQTLRSEL